jgi:BolA protein
VFDDSHKHAGHAEAKAHGGAHIRIEVTSAQFTGLNGVARHRLVYALFAEALAAKKIHALQMTLLAPGEE